jgi:hypothetical protein
MINDDNLDLYLLGLVAGAFTVLGATGISDIKTLSSVVLALLALLALSQIKSRRLTEQIRSSLRGGASALFSREFPADLIRQGLGIVTLCPFYSCRVESEGLGVLVASRAWWRAGGCDAGVPGRFGGSRWRADRGCQAIWLWPSGRFTRIL